MSENIKAILNNGSELLPLFIKAKELSDLHRQFLSVSPLYFTKTTQILGFKLGTLTIATTNATIAAKLRQLAPELVTLMQKKGIHISSIRVKVQISFETPQPKFPPHKLSQTAYTKLNELSLKLNDSPLKQAIENLAKTKT